MKTMKKLLCVILSLVMVLSVFSISAYAATSTAPTGEIDENKINVKFEVEQVAGTDLYTAVDNNIYKLSIYVDAKYGVSFFQVPIHFDKTKFAIVMADDADILNNYMYSYDGNHAEIGDDLIYYYEEPESFSDSKMLTAAGATANNLRAAAYVGLGNSNATKVTPQWELRDATHTDHAKWLGSLSESTGIAFYCLDDLKRNKNAHLNAYEGAIIDGWAFMGAIYFIRLDGVSEEDAIGAEFGNFAGGFGVEGLWDTSGKPSYQAATYIEATPGVNIVSNAVVEKAEVPSIVSACKDQIRFQKNETTGAYANKFDVRTLAKFSVEEFKTLSGGKTPEEAITGAGFIYARNKTVADTDMAAIKAYFADGSALPTGYTDKSVGYITTKAALVGEGNYGFSCIITGVEYPTYVNDTVAVVGYIAYTDADGNTAYNFYEAVNETSFNSLHTTYYPQAAEKYGW